MLSTAIANLLPPMRPAPLVRPSDLRREASLGPGILTGTLVLSLAIASSLIATTPTAAEGAARPNAARGAAARVNLNAGGGAPDKIVRSGAQTSVATVWDCALPNYAPVVSARVEHGTVSIAKANGPRCGRAQMSLTDILYRPAPGFRGTDTLTVVLK